MATKEGLTNKVAGAKPYLQYLISIVLIVNGIGLFTYSIASGALMVGAGLLAFPRIQDILEEQAGIILHPLVLLGIIGFLFVASSAFLLTAVDISEAPDFLVPFEQ